MIKRITKQSKQLILVLFGLVPLSQFAQNKDAEFNLQTALEYAYKHNANYLNAELDARQSNFKKKEIAGLGLPQINGSVDVKDYLEIPTSLLPGQFFGFPPGTYIPVKFGVQYNATAGVSASQLLFSSDYIVGLIAAKELVHLSQKNILRSKAETAQNVTKAYYMVLVNKERIKLLDANIERIKKLLDDTKALNKEGFIEQIDVDRLEVTYNNLTNEKVKIERLIGVSETFLKFQMGFPIEESLSITETLENYKNMNSPMEENSKINFSDRPEYALLESQKKLNEINLKRNRLSYLPTLAGYAALNYNAQRTKFDFFDSKQSWFPIGLIGATLNVPIFDGLQKHYRIQQAKIDILKSKNSIHYLENAIELEAINAKTAFKNALTSLESSSKNMTLAQNIFNVSEKKYQQGVGSNIEVLNAETSLREAQTNYYNSLYDLLIAKTDYQKATGTLVK